jgi:hypothetical protein
VSKPTPEQAGPLKIPEHMHVTVWQDNGCTMIPVRDVLAQPVTVTATYEGGPAWGLARSAERLIAFSFGWRQEFMGQSFEDLGVFAADLAAHLASADAEWPGSEAAVWSLPVVDTKFMFQAVPAGTEVQLMREAAGTFALGEAVRKGDAAAVDEMLRSLMPS